MFERLFKTKEKNKYPKVVEEIHSEFSEAADKLLEEANSILSSTPKNIAEKVNRLKALGFRKSRDVVEMTPVIKRSETAETNLKLVTYYSQNYPYNKFITEEQVKAICEKYNLVMGEVSRFKGFVPEINLQDIENFKLKKPELSTVIGEITRTTDTVLAGSTLVIKDSRIYLSRSYYHIYPTGSRDYFKSAFQSNDGVNFYAEDSRNNFGLANLGTINFRVVSNSLKICAPLKDMETDKNTRIGNGFKLYQHVPDPIVLQPVEGGYLIVTAWGDESKDPEIS